ncbi:MAG: hypothetical protein B7Y62_09070 [Sphingomonadales bacterium 35-56-22]|jgi:hypothetical protein|uniref:hypothetical protein n=1 Tax=Sphingorhabdus sp. TaxID=1902408 RepID=UPI000BD6586C|nr:hypothetical protein [Sphingorhabdus sp.]OYY14879.1 MAG: hypothetical protein B7Y62_09070 [Sphingomonadales bacterium 35-56-22]OYY96990.1 MAG: hypothetical protein B7Y38_09000 [Sphingomonadales bacterium 28-56-43]OYZ59924.1 MAG: hypothetical protein B7Y10_09115 [Sphingomonadales bacterium 24-56-14]OZA82289.1 MAG: hypothetical protein B7X66_09195 [Sphingomonadales bacterium 39-57-19]HQS12621.1 hypothetical protein [Sphingorhabdus sp.]
MFDNFYNSDTINNEIIERSGMKLRLIATGISVAAVTAVTAAPAFGQAEKNETAAKAEKKICKSFLNTGSRLSKTKICKTEAEWAEDLEENAKLLREKRGSQGGPQIGNDG